MFDIRYVAQTQLLLRCLPLLDRHSCFALKGGTAINLFIRDLPRVSVDIDLTYLPLRPREEALAEIENELRSFGHNIASRIPEVTIHEQRAGEKLVKLTASTPDATIKIEPNTVLRGSVYPPENRNLSLLAQQQFELFVRVQCLSEADLYAGKLCAALDRQHPRDLYDVKLLLDLGGITPETRRAFVVYLAGHNRPMNELLNPRTQDIREAYESQFVGMTQESSTLEDLRAIQRELPRKLVTSLDEDERVFLLSLKRGVPEWDRLGIPQLDRLPSLQWKLRNIRRMDPSKHSQAIARLEQVLDR